MWLEKCIMAFFSRMHQNENHIISKPELEKMKVLYLEKECAANEKEKA